MIEAPVVDAVVVLGCAVRGGRPSAALARRIALGARAHREGVARTLVATGGTAWEGHVEADVITAALATLAPGAEVLVERLSRSTRGNALHCRSLLRGRGVRRVMLATCRWHLERALAAFCRCGFDAVPPPVEWLEGPPASLARRARERVSGWLDARLLARVGDME